MTDLKILIVEDERLIALDIQTTLEKSGYKVVGIADSYDKALELLESVTPDLLILDIRLQGERTGIDLAEKLNETRQLPFIFLTSHYDPDTVRQVRETLPYAYLTKPFRDTDLLLSIEMAIARAASNVDAGENEQNEAFLLQDAIFVRDHQAYRKVALGEILFIKGEGSYTALQCQDKKLVVRANLRSFELLTDRTDYARVHRSYLVNLAMVDEIHPKSLMLGDHEVPISRESRDLILQKMRTIR